MDPIDLTDEEVAASLRRFKERRVRWDIEVGWWVFDEDGPLTVAEIMAQMPAP